MSRSTNLCRSSTASNAEFAMHLHGWEPAHRRAQYHSQSELFLVYYRCLSLSENWSRMNNVTLNRSKSQEIIVIDRRRKRIVFNIHHCYLISTVSARSRFLELLYRIAYQSVDMSTTLSHLVHKPFRPCEYYGHMAWQPALYTWFLMPSSLRNSPIRCIIMVGLYDGRGSSTTGSGHSSRHPFWTLRSWSHVSRDARDKLLNYILYSKRHVLHSRTILPDRSDFNYNLRPKRHNFVLTAKGLSVIERDFITRMIFKDICW